MIMSGLQNDNPFADPDEEIVEDPQDQPEDEEDPSKSGEEVEVDKPEESQEGKETETIPEKADAADESLDAVQLSTDLATAQESIEVLEKRIKDKDAYILVLKNNIKVNEEVVVKLSGDFGKVEAFFSQDPAKITVDEFAKMRDEVIPVLRGNSDLERAKAKILNAKVALDITEDEGQEINVALRRDNFTPEAVNELTEKELISYLKTVVKKVEANPNSEIGGLKNSIDELVKTLKGTTPTPKEKLVVEKETSKKGVKPSVMKQAIAPVTKKTDSNKSFTLEADLMV